MRFDHHVHAPPPTARAVPTQRFDRAYKACQVISRLTQAGCDVQTVATRSALKFVGPATLEGLTGRTVATDTFAAGSHMDHIHLMRWADVIVLCPATANTINRLAAGIADDLIGTMFLAHDFTKPYVVVPAVNAAMYAHPATAASLDRMRTWGGEILEPDAGSLACGEIGPGRLADPDVILAEVLARLGGAAPPPGPARRILVTAGGTKAPIDGVRAITNASTGSTGATIAEHFARQGHDVTLLHADGAVVPDHAGITRQPFVTFGDLDTLLRATLGGSRFDAVVHLAAVSDDDVDHVVVDGEVVPVDPSGKLDSAGSVAVHLRKNPKLLPQLKSFAGDPEMVLVGFKLTNGATSAERVAAVASVSTGTDLVVHNDVTEMGGGLHRATIHRGDDVVATTDDDDQLAAALGRFVDDLLDRSASAGPPSSRV